LTSEKYFDALRNGKWHNLEDLADQLEVPIEKLIEFSISLSNQNIIEYQEKTQKIRIKPEWKILLPKEISMAII